MNIFPTTFLEIAVNKLLKRLRTRETTRGLKRTNKIPQLSNTIKIGSLTSTGSAKMTFKIERITLSGTAVRNKRCMLKNIYVTRTKEAFVVK